MLTPDNFPRSLIGFGLHAGPCHPPPLPGRRREIRPIAANQGFVMVAALMFLVILTLVGVSATSTMQVEQIVSRNDRLAQKSFYGAESGIEVAIELIEESLACPQGFKNNQIKGIEVLNDRLWMNQGLDDNGNLLPEIEDNLSLYPSDANDFRHITFPPRVGGVSPEIHTNIVLFGDPNLNHGSGAESSNGYGGTAGKAAAKSGATYTYDIHSRQYGTEDSKAIVRVGYRHLIGTEGECRDL